MSLIQWPFFRKQYDGILNPRFVSDIQAANQGLMDAITAVTGLTGNGFAIITGLNYVVGAPSNTFTPGIFWLNGNFYFVQDAFNEGFYLAPNPTDIMPTLFENGDTNNIYTVQYGVPTAVSNGSSPLFNGNMNQYRINLTYFQSAIIALQAVAATLGTASKANLGTAAGQVLTADQTYTQAQVNALILTRGPSVVGSVVQVYDPTGAFAANFNGSGLGIVFPWINGVERWALMDGQGGRPNMAGVKIVGVGTFTNPDATTKVFANNASGGEIQHTLSLEETPDPQVVIASQTGTTQGQSAVGFNFDKNVDALLKSHAGVSPTSGGGSGVAGPHNVMNPYLAMYIAVRIS